MKAKFRKGSTQLDLSETKILILEKQAILTKEEMLKAQQLAFFLEDARKILEKNIEIDMAISVKDMENKKRREYLDDLIDYQARKEHIYMVTIGYWLITILLGLVAMTLEKYLTDVGIYVIWAGLFLSNVLLVIGHKLYDHTQVYGIIDKFTEKDQLTIIVNPLSSEKEEVV